MRRPLALVFALAVLASAPGHAATAAPKASHTAAPTAEHSTPAVNSLWAFYSRVLVHAKYIDLTHTITPSIPVWHGFGKSRFGPAQDPKTGEAYSYAKNGFAATRYELATDQLGTQLDPPAHWAPEYPSIDELPPTYAVRPLAVISIVKQVARDPGYALQVSDIKRWEAKHGRIPVGSVVMVRSDWSKRWPDPALATEKVFPGVSLAAIKFLYLKRHILFHGHEPLDTDDTPTLEGESWIMHHGYTQAEGVANLDKLPPTGCLIEIGFPKFKGGTGGLARYIAICPPNWEYGVSVDQAPGAPLPKNAKVLHWDRGVRVRN
jgi:kynurenine formamidase